MVANVHGCVGSCDIGNVWHTSITKQRLANYTSTVMEKHGGTDTVTEIPADIQEN
jgi:hypothetical protein